MNKHELHWPETKKVRQREMWTERDGDSQRQKHKQMVRVCG